MYYWLPAILLLPYLIIFLKLYESLRKIKVFSAKVNPTTNISVIIACRNEADKLPSLFNCLSSQNYPDALFELIIIDDHSTDTTFDVAMNFRPGFRYSVLANSGRGKKQAVRTGIGAAIGKFIITTDADCNQGPEWIQTIAAFYEETHADMIICPVVLSTGRGFFKSLQEIEFLSLQGVTAASTFSGNSTMCNGANLAFTKVAYEKHSGNLYDELSTGDDIFLLHSLKKENESKILWLESIDAIVTTQSSSTIKSFFDQRSRWISKAGFYNDLFTITLAIVTFVTILIQIFLLFAGIFDTFYLWILLAITIIKSIPDFLIINNRSKAYGKKKVMKWFLTAQIVYPFYVMGVILTSLKKRNDNF